MMKKLLIFIIMFCALVGGLSYLVLARNRTRYIPAIIKPHQVHISSISGHKSHKRHHGLRGLGRRDHVKHNHKKQHHRSKRHGNHHSTYFVYPGYAGYAYEYPSYRYAPHYAGHTTISDKGGFSYWEVTNNSDQAVIMQTNDGKRTRISTHNYEAIPVPHEKGFDFTLLSDAGQFLGSYQIVDHFIDISKAGGRITARGSN